ncbi:hypothetical protein HNR46_002523 [Haloferula luteola]|uniref:Uncharacterized protein n=1 Tax=Haloferula luteola TaxID=595692 RepID=A0A840VEJ7_9BACT|nr:hypothetical protein [Haloferula luteola]MBB5352280.1 hypothetical protein [Haloferula luteola]
MKKLPLLLLFGFLLQALCAQTPSNSDTNGDETTDSSSSENANAVDAVGDQGFWEASLPGGTYVVALNRICSVSMQEYLLDGNLVVNELNIDTTGRAIARFYFIQPLAEATQLSGVTRAVERGREMIDRASGKVGIEAHNMAQKTYPSTTHAGMIEYRVLDRADLDVIFQSALRAWKSGKGRKVTVQ